MRALLLSLASLSLSACSVFGIRSGYEHSEYIVLDRVGDAEIRQYPKRLAAEVTYTGDVNDAFMVLFDYISGENQAQTAVSMTVPVEVQNEELRGISESTLIAMTVPVEVNQGEMGSQTTSGPELQRSMRFFLPRSFTPENAPVPTDSRVTLVSVSEQTMAALRYSWFSGRERTAEKSEELRRSLKGSEWRTEGAVSFLGYDPPFAIPFLRRNEVVVAVTKGPT